MTGLLAGLIPGLAPGGTFARNPEARSFIDQMVENHQFDRQMLQALFAEAEKRDDILEAIARPAESKPWHQYRPIFLTRSRIAGGVDDADMGR